MVLQPGQSTTVSLEFLMHGNMGGKHNFQVHIKTNDPQQPDYKVAVLSNWIP